MSTTTRITVEQYDEMIRQGCFEPREEHHVELIYGEISPMSPINPPHNDTVILLTRWSYENLPRRAARIQVQGPLGIPALDSVPEPDLAWVKERSYATQHPTPEDVLLVVEVADNSLPQDRGIKAKLYAEAGLQDYWIVNIAEQTIEVRRDPQGSSYRSLEIRRIGEDVRPLAFPEVVLPVSTLFPE